MSKVLKFVVLVAVLLGAAYVAGFWPQRERVSALAAENAALQQRLEAAEARVRGGALLGELLTFEEVVQHMNYGQARGLSSPFFEHAAAEAARTTDAGLKQALTAILAHRDPVTVALTQGDAAALAHLQEAEARLRQALGYPAPGAPPAGASALPGPGAAPEPVAFPSPMPSPFVSPLP